MAKPSKGALAVIRARLNTLSSSERRVAGYVTSHQEDVAKMSMLQVAKGAGVSDATVLRFTRTLGYDGFNEFKIALAAELLIPGEETFAVLDQQDSYEHVVGKVVSTNVQILQDTQELLDAEELRRAVSVIRGARRLYVFAAGTSTPVAEWAYDRLFRLGLPATAITDPYRQVVQASICEDGDVIITISRSGTPRHLIEALRQVAADRPAVQRIAITADPRSPIATLSSVVLVGAAREVRSDVASSIVALSTIVDIVYTCLELEDLTGTVARQRSAWEAIEPLRVPDSEGAPA